MADDDDPPADQAAAADALTRLTAAYQTAAQAADAVADPQRAFDAATHLGEAVAEMGTQAAEVRAHAAERIRTAEQLSLAKLAERLSVSRGRAWQLVEVARMARLRNMRTGGDGSG